VKLWIWTSAGDHVLPPLDFHTWYRNSRWGLRPYSKCKLELLSNFGEILPVIASLSVVVAQLNLTKLKLEYLKFGFHLKKKDTNTDKYFCITRVRLFSSSAQVYFYNTTVKCAIFRSVCYSSVFFFLLPLPPERGLIVLFFGLFFFVVSPPPPGIFSPSPLAFKYSITNS